MNKIVLVRSALGESDEGAGDCGAGLVEGSDRADVDWLAANSHHETKHSDQR